MLRGDFGRSKASNLGRKSGSEAMKIGREKWDSSRGGLEIRLFRKMGLWGVGPASGDPQEGG